MSRGTKNKIEDLRDHLFATLESLRDDENPMDLDRAKAISDVSQTIINSAKVEIDYLKVMGDSPGDMRGSGTQFIPSGATETGPAQPPQLRAVGKGAGPW